MFILFFVKPLIYKVCKNYLYLVVFFKNLSKLLWRWQIGGKPPYRAAGIIQKQFDINVSMNLLL